MSELDDLLAEAAAAAPNERVGRCRDRIAAYGESAVERLTPWLQDRALAPFAVQTIERAALAGFEEVAVAALRVAARHAPSVGVARDISRALERIDAAGRPASQTERGAGGALVHGMPAADRPFVPPLSDGERDLIQRLKEALPNGWEMFVRPHLDGDRPALGLLHPERGAMVWDVREWNLFDYRLDADGRWERLREGAWSPTADPVKRLNRVRTRIYAEYVPGYGEAIDGREQLFGIVRAGIYLPTAQQADLDRLGLTGGREIVVPERGLNVAIKDLVPNAFQPVEIEPEWHAVLRRRFSNFHPPTFGGVRLNTRQLELVNDEVRPGTWALEGVAGSGKSLVLSRRAARLAASGRRALLLTYNITLANYCRGLVEDAPNRFDWTMLVVQHAHGLCNTILRRLEAPGPSRPLARDNRVEAVDEALEQQADDRRYDIDWPEWTRKAIDRWKLPEDLRFDVIMVDEAQDLSVHFVELLQRCLRPSGELLFAYDRAQRLYSRADVTVGPRLKSMVRGVRTLDTGYRLSVELAGIANHLARAAELPTNAITIDAMRPGLLDDGGAGWAETTSDAESCAAIVAVLERFRDEDGYRPDSTAVLAPRSIGPALVRLMEEHDIVANSVFPLLEEVGTRAGRSDWQLRGRPHKTTFVPHDQRTKVSTVHSFKGWEAERIVLALPEAKPPKVMSPVRAPALYVAITRAMRQLTVVGPRDTFGLLNHVGRIAVPIDDLTLTRAQVLIDGARASAPDRRHPAYQERPTSASQDQANGDEEWNSLLRS